MPDPLGNIAFTWPFYAGGVIAYLIGALPMGLIVARLFKLGDLRRVGSGNIGATNVLRTGNKAAAALTLLLDGGKGAVAVVIAQRFGPDMAVIAAGAVVVGHIAPVWLLFKGGKGVATTLGVLLAIAWPVGLIACGLWLAVAGLFRYSSLAALIAICASPGFALVFDMPQIAWLAGFLAVIVTLRHAGNIVRLARGREPRIGRSAPAAPEADLPAGPMNVADTNERRTLSEAERLDWLRLARCENVGPITFFALLDRFGSPAAVLDALPALARRGGRRRPIKVCSRAAAEREVEALTALGGRMIALVEPAYPQALAAIPDPPPVIAVRGRADLLLAESIAVVGARNASANGMHFAERLAADLGAAGLTVVSGMARGIDARAHAGAIETGTVAVMGGGADVVYPKENRSLFERLLAEGAVISEAPLGTVPMGRHFPRRNRIIAGLSRGVVVVEGAARSGSLITARLALEQGREVMAVPGSPLDPRASGPNGLIRQGATLVENADDVLDALAEGGRPVLGEPRQQWPSDAALGVPEDDEAPTSARETVAALLGSSPVPVDLLVRQSRLTPAMVATILLELELAGRLERHPGNRVSHSQPAA